MKKLLKAKTQDIPVVNPADTQDNEVLDQPSDEAIQKELETASKGMTDEEKAIASSQNMDFALQLVADKFGLDHRYIMTKWADGNNNCAVVLSNENFEVTVKVKNKLIMGFPTFE